MRRKYPTSSLATFHFFDKEKVGSHRPEHARRVWLRVWRLRKVWRQRLCLWDRLYFEDEPGRAAAKLLTRDEARRILSTVQGLAHLAILRIFPVLE
jgi:hypothetical protein